MIQEGEVIKVNATKKQLREIASDNKIRIPKGVQIAKGSTIEVACSEENNISRYLVRRFIIKDNHIHVQLKGGICI